MLKPRVEAPDDLNPQETVEWVESLDQVIDHAGPDRATYLLEKLTERARANGVELPVQLNTPYINTIRAEEEVPYPGDPLPASAMLSAQKPGSVLFYNFYSSDAANLKSENTRVNLTNTDPARTAKVRLIFVNLPLEKLGKLSLQKELDEIGKVSAEQSVA